MIAAPPWMMPKPSTPDFDIYYGADVDDIGEIEGALTADPAVLNQPEPLTGKTALTIAAADGNYLSLEFLLVTHRADPWIKDKKGWLALDYARAIGHQGCRELLLKHMHPELDGDTGNPDVVPLFPRRG